jgi:hypothetical protein
MIQYLMDALGFAPQDTVFVGDLDSDRQAAEAANVKFEWADDFFNRLEEEVVEVAEPEVDPTSTIVIEEPFPDDEDEDEDEEEGDDEDEEEDYWAQWEDDDDEDTDDTDDDTDDDSSDSSDDGDTDDSDSSSNSADVSGDADSGGASEVAPASG